METTLNLRDLDAIRAGCQAAESKDILSLGWERYAAGTSSKKISIRKYLGQEELGTVLF